LIGVWVKLLQVPYRLMFPAIIIFCCIGIYSINNSPTEVLLTAAFALFGYLLLKLGFEIAPLLLGFVLGRLMEEKLRQAMVISRGSLMTFIERPVSLTLLILAVIVIAITALPAIRKSRETVFTE
jgi:putative tricarboxylic transport membrane protein